MSEFLTRQDAFKRAQAKFPGKEIVLKTVYGASMQRLIGCRLRAPSGAAMGYAVVGKGPTWARAVLDMEVRLVYGSAQAKGG